MSELLKRLMKNSKIKESNTVQDSGIINSSTNVIKTDTPIINIALGGSIHSGLTSGLTVLAGPSRHYKSNLGLIMVRAFLDSDPEAVCMFYDSEFGSTAEYFNSLRIDTNRVIHMPIVNIEELKFDLVNQLQSIDKKDKVIIFIDSVGNLASKKELDDAINENTAADMTRAKQLKSLFRMVTPYLTMKEIPMIAINHVYDNIIGIGHGQIMSGGTGPMLSASRVFFMGRQQEKNGTQLEGYNFIINAEKSRYIREKSKLPLHVTFEGGIDKYSGLLDLAIEGGFVVKPSMGWYAKVDQETGEISGNKLRAKDTNSDEFWNDILENPKFDEFIQKKYRL